METQQQTPKRQRLKIVVVLLVGIAIGELRNRPWSAPKGVPDLRGRMTIRHYGAAPVECDPVWIHVDDKPVFSAATEVKGRRQVLVKLADGRVLIDAVEVEK